MCVELVLIVGGWKLLKVVVNAKNEKGDERRRESD